MKIFFSLLFVSIIIVVNSESPLQIDSDASVVKHDHGSSSGESKVFSGNTKIRLSKNVLPVLYELKITPVLEKLTEGTPVNPPQEFTAPGEVTITVICNEVTDTIQLHKHEILNIDNTTLTVTAVTNPAENPFGAAPEIDEDNELYIIKLNKQLTKGSEYKIYVKFIAPVDFTGRNNGLYRSQYIDPATTRPSYIATTQFEAASARQAFPCFDEPAIKAKFQVTIGYNNKTHKALTNSAEMEGQQTDIPGWPSGWVYQPFQTTVNMSTYLVAIVVANYDFEPAPDGIFDKPTRIYGPPHLMKDFDDVRTGGVYSAKQSASLLKFFEERYEIKYQLPKMDSIVVTDFNYGAMENWGLNIYRQDYLLFHEGESTESERKRITSILSHELAHQWFGNLVTCEWWSFIWLNEGFATYNEFVGAHAVAPEFQFDKLSLPETLHVALLNDILSTTHPLVNSAHPDEQNDKLMTYFDRITYQKGGSLIFMMEAFLGEDTFKTALINYLKGMAFRAAQQDQLFRYLTEQAHKDNKISPDITMKDIMDTWTLQIGFPLVRVSRAAGSTRLYISQERFINDGKPPSIPPKDLDPNDLWHVPIAITTANNPNFSNHTPSLWLKKTEILKSISIDDTTKWVIVNPDATGYYRVLYDTYLTNLIVEQLKMKFDDISEKTRSQLVDDYFTFAEKKYINLETALQFTRYITNETEVVVWSPILIHLRKIFNKLSGSSAFEDFRKYILPRIQAGLLKVGNEQPDGDKGWKVILRAQLLDWACSLDQTTCREYATKLFDAWNEDEEKSIPVDIKAVVFCSAVSSGGLDYFDKIKEKYKRADGKEENKLRTALLAGMACTQEVSIATGLLEQVLEETTEPIFINRTDKGTLLERLAANSQTRPSIIKFLRENLMILISTLKSTPVARVVLSLSSYVATQPELDDITELITGSNEDFWDSTDLPNVKNYIKTIGENVAWRNEYYERLKEWFSTNL